MSEATREPVGTISATRPDFSLWIHRLLATALHAEPETAYDHLATLRPLDDFVEKQGRSTGRFQVFVAGEALTFYLKRYPIVSWWQRRWAALDTFPGTREFSNLRKVAALGIAVPETLAVGANRRHPCVSLFATRELRGYLPLHQFIPSALRNPNRSPSVLRTLTIRLAQIARSLHAADLYHRDFYLCHFFARETTDGALEVILIDLARLKHSHWSRWRVKDLAQLLFSSDVHGITRTERLRFFLRYLQIGRLDAPSRKLLARVTAKAERYRRHNEKHQRVPLPATSAAR